MTVFRQLGDPLAGAVCLCEHHGAAYAERAVTGVARTPATQSIEIAPDEIIIQVEITTTETCCVVVNAAMVTDSFSLPTDNEIERPLGTIRTQQEDEVTVGVLELLHYASWEVLPAGTYTYYLVRRLIGTRRLYLAWIKAIASDCEG